MREVIGDDYVDISASRLRQFGGTSNHWGGVCHPLEKHDFNKWPINKNDLDIYRDETMQILIYQVILMYQNLMIILT